MSASPLDPPAPSAGIPPTDETINLVARFFDAIYQLIERRVIRGKKTFCDRYGINRWNFNTCEKTPESGMFKLSWLTYLVRDYGVSADWLLVGRGVALPPLTGDALAKYKLYKKRKAVRTSSERPDNHPSCKSHSDPSKAIKLHTNCNNKIIFL